MKRLFQFLSSRYRNHQAGFALNIVIIFMLLSQLLYWSLIVKNQYATRQYKQYQRHYLNQIQLLVSEKLFEGVILDPVSYTHLTLPTTLHECRSRWSPYH